METVEAALAPIMPLYHASSLRLPQGQELRFSPGQARPNMTRPDVDEFLDTQAHKGMPRRATSVFCCDSLASCVAYADSQVGLKQDYVLYEVRALGNVHHAPMVIPGRLARHGLDHPHASAMAVEYWRPTQVWRYIEVLADAVVVVTTGVASGELDELTGRVSLGSDRDLAASLGW